MKIIILSIFVLISSSLASAQTAVNLEVLLRNRNTLVIKFTNKGEKKEKIHLQTKRYPSFNYAVWIESFDGYKNTACHYCDDNWFYPASIWASTKPPEKEKKIVLRPGQTYTQELELTRLLIPLLSEITQEEADKRINEGDEDFIAKLALIENDLMKMPFSEALSKENGPFKLKIRWKDIESNWIELNEIQFEQSAAHNERKRSS